MVSTLAHDLDSVNAAVGQVKVLDLESGKLTLPVRVIALCVAYRRAVQVPVDLGEVKLLYVLAGGHVVKVDLDSKNVGLFYNLILVFSFSKLFNLQMLRFNSKSVSFSEIKICVCAFQCFFLFYTLMLM